MNDNDILKIFNVTDIIDLPAAVQNVINGSVVERDSIYKKIIAQSDKDMSYDWFQGMYEKELSQRKQAGQNFSDSSVSKLVSKLTGVKKGCIHEPTAGTGSLIIADWYERCQSIPLYKYRPSDNVVCCWELSDRSIPILLLNLSIRGIMGYVYHGDVLEQTVKNKYILLNINDDFLAFSEIIKVDPNTEIYNTITNTRL